jgi:hypothetical protein
VSVRRSGPTGTNLDIGTVSAPTVVGIAFETEVPPASTTATTNRRRQTRMAGG